MSTWMEIVVVLLIIAVGVVTLGWMLGSMIEDYFNSKASKQFEKDLEAALNHSQPSWNEVTEISRVNGIPQNDIIKVCRKIMKNILTGEAGDLEKHKELIKSYIDKYNEEEPFEGMPSEIRIHLERLKERTEDSKLLLDPLTNQIKDLISVNNKERKSLKYYTVGGFFVGFVGLCFAVYSFYFVEPNIQNVEIVDPAVITETDKT